MEISSNTPLTKWIKDDSDENSKKQVKQESFDDLNKPGTWSDKKNETLKEELKATHDAYKAILNDEREQTDTFNHLLEQERSERVKEKNKLESHIVNIETENDQMKQELSTLISAEREWIGRTLKMEFIFKKMIQAGAIQPDHSEWVLPMFEDIDIPYVPISTREEFVPTALTGVVGDSSEDEDDEEILEANPPHTRDLPRREHNERIVPTENISAEMIRDYFSHVYPETDDEEQEESFYGRASTYDEVTVYPESFDYDSLPWYLRRFPTPTERMAIILIQKAWRNRQ